MNILNKLKSENQLKSKMTFNENTGVKNGEVWLSGFVGEDWYEDGVSLRTLKRYVDSRAMDRCKIYLETEGGYVSSGMALASYMEMSEVFFEVVNIGMVASAGTLILAGADLATGVDGALTMIHNPTVEGWGLDAKELRKSADMLEKVKSAVVSIYISKIKRMKNIEGKESAYEKMLSKMMDEETWLTTDEAIELGLIDRKSERKVKEIEKSELDKKNILNHALNYKNMSKISDWLEKFSPKVEPTMVAVGEDKVKEALELLKDSGYSVVETPKTEVKAETPKAEIENIDERMGKMESLLMKIAEKTLAENHDGDVEVPKKKVLNSGTIMPNVSVGKAAAKNDPDDDDTDIFLKIKNGSTIKSKMEALANAFKSN